VARRQGRVFDFQNEVWYIPKGTAVMEVITRDSQLQAMSAILQLDVTIDEKFAHIPLTSLDVRDIIADHIAFTFTGAGPPTRIYVPADALKLRHKPRNWVDANKWHT
jgi:hypothetical protein